MVLSGDVMVWIWGRSGDDLEMQKQYCGVTVPATWGLRSRGSEAAAVGFWGCNGCSTGCGCTVLPGGCVDAHSPAFSPPQHPSLMLSPPCSIISAACRISGAM